MALVQPQLALNQPTSRVLTWGFRISGALLILGLLISAIQGEELHTSLESIPELIETLLEGDGAAIVGLGILTMMITPIASTISIIASCIRLGDRRFAMITTAVLVILFISATIAAL
jgi:uncharacterized membrane protein